MSEPLNPLDYIAVRGNQDEHFRTPGMGSDAQPRTTDTERPVRSTGPRTPEGKAISSQNRLTHGLRSKQVILPDEDQEDFDALRDRWLHEFRPDTEASINLVEKLILNDWLCQ